MLDLTLDLVAIALDRGDSLLTTLVGLFVQLLRADAGVGLEAVSLATRLVGDALSLGASFTDHAVGLFLGRVHQLVGIVGGNLQEPGSGRRRIAHGWRTHRGGGYNGHRSRLGLWLGSGRRCVLLHWLLNSRGRRGLRCRCGRLDRGYETGGFTGRCGSYLGAKFFVLDREPLKLGLDLVEKLIHFAHVIAFAKTDRRKTFVTHVLWRQRHEYTSRVRVSPGDTEPLPYSVGVHFCHTRPDVREL